ncbi:MAG: choice-of-anchor D domain-containing protein, partial [Candidatus Kapaibacterium sp.]
MLRILLGLMIIIIGFEGMLAQTFTLFDVDRSQFPRMKAKFYLTDEYGNSINSISKNDLFIDEDGVPRQVLSVSCPPVKPALAVSSVLVMDASGSMGGPNIAMAKIGAAAYIKSLRNPQSETAITLFDDKNYLVTDFMTDRNFLLNKINEIYYNKLGWTDYNAALIAPPSGALQLLQYSRHKKVVLFLSDGAPTTITEVSRIVDQALLQKVKIYSIAINMSISKDMKEIATKTGGLWYDNVDSEEKARKIYEEILELEQGNESPCEIEWMSDYACSPKNVNVNVTENMTGQYYNLEYEVPEHGVVGLIFEPQSISMSGVGVSQSKDTVIKAIAVNRDFYINSIVGDANVFSIKPEIDTVYAGDTVEFTITYTPKDSNFVMCEFKVRSDKCPISVFATGGFPGKAPTLPSLRLTHPNGGEVFVAGSDTVITWTGLALSDTVMLEYSTNRGIDWNVITKSATNLVYNWKNIPKTPSIECLVRATQINNAGFDDHIFTGGRQLVEKGTRILRDNTGNLIIIGSFTGTTTIGNRSIISRGGYDIFVAKFGPVGNTHWVISAGGSGNDYGKDIDVDLFNNIYITGEFSNQANFGPHLVTSKGGSDVFAAKIDPAGNFQWVNSGGGLGNDIGAGIASDRNGNIAITGGFEGVAQFSSKDLFSIGNYDAFIVKYNSNGNLQWARSGGGAGKVIGKDVCDDKDGNITIVGEYTSTAVFGTQMINSQSRGEEDIFVLKYDPTGNMIWAKSYGGPGNDIPNAIDCDSEGNTTIAGAFRGIIQLTNKPKESRQYDAFVFKLNPSGNVIWANYGGGPGNDAAHGVASDFDGSIAITGYFTDEAQFALDSLTGFGARDVFAVKYNNNGDLLWSRAAGSSADDTGNGVTFDRDSRVSIIGDFQKRIFFGDNYRDAYGNGDFFIWRTKITYIQEDLSDSLFSIVMPLPQAIDVDMKQVLTGTSKDSVVSNLVQNLGTYQLKVDDIFFRGADAQSFSIVSGFPAFNVPPHENGQVELRFAPTREGNHTAEMIFIIQSDTIIRNIRGSGIRPMLKIVNPVIDFGKVEVDDSKDTIQAITIRNVGSAILYIDSTKHGLPNYTDFSTLSGGGKFQLNPGQEHTMDLRFTARDKGFTTGSLEFYYSAPGSPAVVQLFAEGIDLNPFISYELEPFVDLICENVDDKTLTIYNTGVNDLIISSIEIQGDDASDFTIDNIY